MNSKEAEKSFLDKVSEYLLSLPFDLKILQEAVTDPDLDRRVREMAAGTIIHTLLPQEGESPGRYVDDVLLVRAALDRIIQEKSEGTEAFRARFAEVYDKLEDDLRVFALCLGDLWPWLQSKLDTFPKQVYKGKKPSQCVDDEEIASFLYVEGLEFLTNYTVSEEMVRNRVRKVETLIDLVHRRRVEEAKKRS